MASPAPRRPELEAEPPTILAPVPASRRVVLPVAAIDPNGLGIGELLDLAEALGTDLTGVAELMRDTGQVPRSRVIVGLAWLLVRRLEPGVTWAEAQTWRVEVTPAAAPDPTPAPPGRAVESGL
jgi:hypothetical protein